MGTDLIVCFYLVGTVMTSFFLETNEKHENSQAQNETKKNYRSTFSHKEKSFNPFKKCNAIEIDANNCFQTASINHVGHRVPGLEQVG